MIIIGDRYCKNCGKKVESYAEFCSNCGEKQNRKRNKIIIPVIAGVIFIIIVAILVGFFNSPKQRINRKLDLGERFLNEGRYEEAVLCYLDVIDIDSKETKAYLGAAKAYIGLEEYNKADEILHEGYELTENKRILKLISSINDEVEKEAEHKANKGADHYAIAEEIPSEEKNQIPSKKHDEVLIDEEVDVERIVEETTGYRKIESGTYPQSYVHYGIIVLSI